MPLHMTDDAWWVLTRTFAASTTLAALAGWISGRPEAVFSVFESASFLIAALLCWIRVGIGEDRG